jgi:transposase-like protein
MIQCKKCSSTDYNKSGIVNGKQRYKCKKCGTHYTLKNPTDASQPKQKNIKKKALSPLIESNPQATFLKKAEAFLKRIISFIR